MIESRIDGNILHVTINRPEKRNALTPEMLFEVSDAICRVDEQPHVRAVILSAAGPVFCAGIDIASLAAGRAKAAAQNPGRWLRRLADRMQYALHSIEATEVPVIAAMQGQVIGMGLELVLACDLRVAADDCLLSIPEARMGLVADVGGTTRLARTVGPARAKDLLLTCRTLDAAEARNWGLITRTAHAAGLLEAATTLANQIAANAPLAVGLSKRLADLTATTDPHTAQILERWAQSQLVTTEDHAEAARAFLEKRGPGWKGM